MCITNGETVWGHSESGFSSHGQDGSYDSWIRHLGAVKAWPDLLGCIGTILDVADIGTGTGVTSGTGAGATGRGCGSCAGLAGAGGGAEMCSLAGACGVAGVVSVGLTLHS